MRYIVAIWSFNRRFRYTIDADDDDEAGNRATDRSIDRPIKPFTGDWYRRWSTIQWYVCVADCPQYILILTIDAKRCNSILLITLRSQSCGNSVAVIWSLSRFKSISWTLLILSLSPPLRGHERAVCMASTGPEKPRVNPAVVTATIITSWLTEYRFPHGLGSHVSQLSDPFFWILWE